MAFKNLGKKLTVIENKIRDDDSKERAKEKRIRKGKIRIGLRNEGKAWQDWPI